jgi:hypothetical protein
LGSVKSIAVGFRTAQDGIVGEFSLKSNDSTLECHSATSSTSGGR